VLGSPSLPPLPARLAAAPVARGAAPALQEVNDNRPAYAQTRSMTHAPMHSRAGGRNDDACARPDLTRARAPGIARRLATMLYDLLLLFGVVVLAAALFYTAFNTITGSEAITGAARVLFQVYLLAVCIGYYLYFWTGGRQTLGMRAWRTRLLRTDGGTPSATDALRRLALAALTLLPAGIGLLWVLFDRDGLTWYDRLSRTRPVLTVKPGRKQR
jgi:uncharacterized RDD family membrane protein YckC